MMDGNSEGDRNPPIRVALVACGLGRINRGFETTTWNWFRTMQGTRGMEFRVFGGGPVAGGTQVANFARNGIVCRGLRNLGLIHDGCRVEQASFAIGFLPTLLAWKPHVIWFQELTLGRCLRWWRKRLGLQFRLAYCNGAPLGPADYGRFDFIHHLEPQSLAGAQAAGLESSRMAVLPHVLPPLEIVSRAEGAAWRRLQGIPPDAWVVLSVAAWNTHHKRIDYVLREVAAMRYPNVHLLLCGEPEAEAAALQKLGQELLPGRVHWRTLPQSEMPLAYAAADAFVLGSLTEAFGLVLIESAIRGVPTLSHEHPAGRFIFDDDRAWLADLSAPGAMAARLAQWKADATVGAQGAELKNLMERKFGAEVLRPQFAALLRTAVGIPLLD